MSEATDDVDAMAEAIAELIRAEVPRAVAAALPPAPTIDIDALATAVAEKTAVRDGPAVDIESLVVRLDVLGREVRTLYSEARKGHGGSVVGAIPHLSMAGAALAGAIFLATALHFWPSTLGKVLIPEDPWIAWIRDTYLSALKDCAKTAHVTAHPIDCKLVVNP